jgi:hypothetical protein
MHTFGQLGQCLLQGIENEACMCRPGDAPPDDASGEGVDDERHMRAARTTAQATVRLSPVMKVL